MDNRPEVTANKIVEIFCPLVERDLSWAEIVEQLQTATHGNKQLLNVMHLEAWAVYDEAIQTAQNMNDSLELFAIKRDRVLEQVNIISRILEHENRLNSACGQVCKVIYEDIEGIGESISREQATALFSNLPILEKTVFKNQYPFVWQDCKDMKELIMFMIDDTKTFNQAKEFILDVLCGREYPNEIQLTDEDLI
jgi:hypothetical protein